MTITFSSNQITFSGINPDTFESDRLEYIETIKGHFQSEYLTVTTTFFSEDNNRTEVENVVNCDYYKAFEMYDEVDLSYRPSIIVEKLSIQIGMSGIGKEKLPIPLSAKELGL